jgi:chemotaxis signal transduction protein
MTMRLTLFRLGEERFALPLAKVLHIVPAPEVFNLPLLRPLFRGVCVRQDELVPIVSERVLCRQGSVSSEQTSFLLICEAEYGGLGIPAALIERITAGGEVNLDSDQTCDARYPESFELAGSEYRLLDLNLLLETPKDRAPVIGG